MSIQPDKAVWMLASRAHVDRTQLHLWYGPKQVPQETSVVYLGITMDTKMTMNTHMEALGRKVAKGLNVLKYAEKPFKPDESYG